VAYREHVDPLVGPAAYEAFTVKLYADNPKQIGTWTTDAVQVTESGDLAVQTGQFHVTGIGPKGDGEDRGRFVTIWKKVNGEWKVAHDIGSTTMPAPGAEKK
jgi:ketosteroid isomerase-like protein